MVLIIKDQYKKAKIKVTSPLFINTLYIYETYYC